MFCRANLTSISSFGPPNIPDFTTTINYDRSKPSDRWEMYTLLVEAAGRFGVLPWDAVVGSPQFIYASRDLSIWLNARFVHIDGQSHLRIQHLIMAIYEIGVNIFESPSLGMCFDTHAALVVQRQPIADIKIEKRSSKSTRTGANGDIAFVGTISPRNISLLGNPRPASRGDKFEIVDYQNPGFRVFGTFTGDEIDIAHLLTASLNALAQASMPRAGKKGAKVYAVSARFNMQPRYTAMGIENIRSRPGTELLSYGQVLTSIRNLWHMFLIEGKYGSLRFSIEMAKWRVKDLLMDSDRERACSFMSDLEIQS